MESTVLPISLASAMSVVASIVTGTAIWAVGLV